METFSEDWNCFLGSQCGCLVGLSGCSGETSFGCTTVISKHQASESSWVQPTSEHYLPCAGMSRNNSASRFFHT